MKSITLLFCLTVHSLADLKLNYLIQPSPKAPGECPCPELIWLTKPKSFYRVDTSPDMNNWTPGKVFLAEDIIAKRTLPTDSNNRDYVRVARVDLTPPLIVNRSPQDQNFSISRESSIVIELSDESGINPDSILISVGEHHNVAIGPNLSFKNNIITFTPDAKGLGEFGETITVELVVEDNKGNSHKIPEKWDFELELPTILRPDLFDFGSLGAQKIGQIISEEDLNLIEYLGRNPDRGNPGLWTLSAVDETSIEIHSQTPEILENFINTLQLGQALVNTQTVEVKKQFFREITKFNKPIQLEDKTWKIIIATTDIPFEHCFEQVSFSLDGRSKGFHIDEGKLIVPKQNKRRSILGIDREARFHLIDIESDWSDREFFTAYDNIGLSFDELGFSAQISGSAHIKYQLGGTGNKVRASLTASAQAACEPVFKINYEGNPVNIDKTILPKRTIYQSLVPVGPIAIPVYLSFETRFKAHVDVAFHGEIRGGFSYDKNITYYYEWQQSGGVDKGAIISGDGFQRIPLTLEAKGELKAGVSLVPRLELGIGGTFYSNLNGETLLGASAGVSGAIIAHADLEAEASTQFTQEGNVFSASACLNAGLGYDVDAFYWVEINPPFTSWNLHQEGSLDLIDGEFINPALRWCWDYSDFYEWGGFEQFVPSVRQDLLNTGLIIPPPGPVVSEVGGKNSGVKYQWFKDGSPIPGKNSPTLILDKATEYHAGNYQLLATEKGVSHFSKEIPVTIVESLKPLVDHRK